MNTRRSLTALAIGLTLAVGARAQDPGARIQEEGQAGREGTARLDRIRRLTEMIGAEVRGVNNEERIADVNDLILDDQGRIRYFLVGSGGVAGVGEDVHAVPFHAAVIEQVEDRGWHLQLDMDAERLQQAPALEGDDITALSNDQWIEANRTFFQGEAADPTREGAAEDAAMLFRASALDNSEVRSPTADSPIADVEDLLFDAEFTAAYAVLGYGGVADVGENLVPIPFDQLQISRAAGDDEGGLEVMTRLSRERLDSAPKLEGEWNRMLDPGFVDRIDTFFGAAGQPSPSGAIDPIRRPEEP